MFHPWRRVRDTPEIDVEFTDEPVYSCFSFRHQRAKIARDGLQTERRSDINHEWWHWRRGPLPAGSTQAQKDAEERTIEILSARELISIEDLGEAMVWTSDMAEVADELWVDMPCLWARLGSLSDDERVYLDRRVHKMTGEHDETQAGDVHRIGPGADGRMRRQ